MIVEAPMTYAQPKALTFNNLTGRSRPGSAFTARTNKKPGVPISGCGGRFSVIGFFGDALDPAGQAALETLRQCRDIFNYVVFAA